ncbi:T9SS C-terminal target domain-containing protein [Bacteroidetes/Chlorobi group bacterium ChocPot_Mid]|nr:MAG: T9SS C-terminal target domain-containing protein [Bacteroidetes/Chlorobi group bacterium ChocPot_Mid]
MKYLFLIFILLLSIITLTNSAVVKIDNGTPSGHSYQPNRAFFEESVVLTPAGPCTIDSITIYLSGTNAVKDTLWIVGFPTSGNLWPTQYIWHFNSLIEPIVYNYDGIEGWKTVYVGNTGLRSEGLDRIVIQHRLKPQGPWFTYDSDGRNNTYDSWICDPFTPNPNFLNIAGTIYYYPAGDYMGRLIVTYDFPKDASSDGPPPPYLINVSSETGLSGRGMSSVVDWNNDGWDDIENAGSFFVNNKGFFQNINSQLTIQRGATTWGDINNDGLLDMFVALSWGTDKVYLNNGSNSYTDITSTTTIVNNYPTMTPIWLDYNNDGLLDLFIANNRSSDAQGNETYYPDQLWKNNGDNTFSNVRYESGIANGEPSANYDCYGAQAVDYNNDNYTDIFVANYRLAPDNLYKNQGNSTFVDVKAETGVQGVPTAVPYYFGHGMGCEWGDFNNDGYIDLCVGNLAHTDSRGQYSNPSLIYKNNGPPNWNFTEVHKEMGLKFYEGNAGVLWLDLDLDGYLDLWHGLYSGGVNHLYLNQGPPDFKLREITWVSGSVVTDPWTAQRIDYDNDGDLDLLIYGALYRNDMPRKGNWLELKLSGSPENNVNMDAYGSRVTVYAGGKMFYRQLSGSAGGSRCVQNSNYLHFGLGYVQKADSVVIVYSNGATNKIYNLPVNAKYKIPYMQMPEQTGIATPALKYPKVFENNVGSDVQLEWHQSTGANNYSIQICDNPEFDIPRIQLYSNITSKNVESLNLNTTYFWRVKAFSDFPIDSSQWSSVWEFTVGKEKPGKIHPLLPADNAEDVSAYTQFRWTPVKYTCSYCFKNSYEILISDDKDFNGNFKITISEITDTTYKMEGSLKPATKYYWKVRAVNEDVPGDWSEVFSFTTLLAPQQTILSEPSDGATEVDDRPKFIWNSALRADSYQLQVALDPDFEQIAYSNEKIKTTSFRNLAVRLTTGTKHYWHVRAINEGGAGPWSDTWSFTVKGVAPSVDELLNSLTKFDVNPNPSRDFIDVLINLPCNGLSTISIFNITGTELSRHSFYSEKNSDINIRLDINNLPAGVYLCRLSGGQILKTARFIVIK